jgi:hypothetical protein
MSIKAIARHRAAAEKTKIATFDEWIAAREGLDKEVDISGFEEEEDQSEEQGEEEPLVPRKRRRIDVPPSRPVCLASSPLF